MEQKICFKNIYGEKLAGTLHVPEQPSVTGVVMGHCFTCSRHTSILKRIGEDLADAGFMALRFDFSGNGQSQGDFIESTYSKQISEMGSAIDFIRLKGVSWIALAGHSMGAAVALLSASQTKSVKAVCVLGGRSTGLISANFLNEKQKEEIKLTGRTLFVSRRRSLELSASFFEDAKKYDLPKIISSLNQPLLFVHGSEDEIISVNEAYYAKKLKPENTLLEIIEGADHMFLNEKHRRQVSSRVVEWLKNMAGM